MNWLPIYTNTVPGLLNFTDSDATNYPARFYRMSWPDADQAPELSAPRSRVPAVPDACGQRARVAMGHPASADLVDWAPIFTNQPGGAMDFVDASATNPAGEFYRVWRVPPAPPGFTVLDVATNVTVVRVDSALRPYVVEVSTNQGPLSRGCDQFQL